MNGSCKECGGEYEFNRAEWWPRFEPHVNRILSHYMFRGLGDA